jgi:hypothetical protein
LQGRLTPLQVGRVVSLLLRVSAGSVLWKGLAG